MLKGRLVAPEPETKSQTESNIMKAIVVEETLTDNSTVFNVMLKGEDVASPPSVRQAQIIADRINAGCSARAAVATLQIEAELISDASETIGTDMAKVIDESLAADVEAFEALIKHVQALEELGIALGVEDRNDHEPILAKAESALLRLTPVAKKHPFALATPGSWTDGTNGKN